MPKNENTAAAEKPAEPAFSKQELLFCKKFEHMRYLLAAVLEDGRKYTIQEAENAVDEYLRRRV